MYAVSLKEVFSDDLLKNIQKLAQLCQMSGSVEEQKNPEKDFFDEQIFFFKEKKMAEIFQEILQKNNKKIKTSLYLVQENLWKKFLKPFIINSLKIVPFQEGLRKNKEEILIKVGEAFGTGHHETTRLCIKLMKEIPKQKNVLDLGCGTGILTLSYLEIFPQSLLEATDIDSKALQLTKENLHLNHKKALVGLKPKRKYYDLVMANILLETLLEMKDFLKNQSYLILSGITYDQERLLLKEYSSMKCLKRKREKGWTAFLLAHARTL